MAPHLSPFTRASAVTKPRQRGSGKNVGGKEGKTMELPKHPFSIHVVGVKQEYRRAKLSGARYFDVRGKFESFWRLKL